MEQEFEHVLGEKPNEKLERILAELDVTAGEDNIIGLDELELGLEAVGDNVLVLIDSYKSGYECGQCGGSGKLRRIFRCICDPEVPDEKLSEVRGEGVLRGTRNKFGAVCETCGGDYQSKRIDELVECPKCGGKGGLLIIPDSAQSLPTTGIILSVGPDVTRGGIKINRRIVATPHSGILLPMKGNIPIKVYRQHEPLCVLYTMDKHGNAIRNEPGRLETPQFVEYETPLNPQHKK